MDSNPWNLKRLRRTYEPEEKSWNDKALETPWDLIDPPISPHVLFAMKNIFFFSHATPVQLKAIQCFSNPSSSMILEAPTGSGKTLAFLIPIVQRILSYSEKTLHTRNSPFLSRSIVSIILSPSRVLAEQTYLVGKQLVARFPLPIRFVLCNGGILETAETLIEKISISPRSAGIILVSTPYDALQIVQALALNHSNTHEEYSASASLNNSKNMDLPLCPVDHSKKKFSKEAEVLDNASSTHSMRTRKTSSGIAKSGISIAPNEKNRTLVSKKISHKKGDLCDRKDEKNSFVEIRALPGQPFILVIDEADLILKTTSLRSNVFLLLHKLNFNIKNLDDYFSEKSSVSLQPNALNSHDAIVSMAEPPRKRTKISSVNGVTVGNRKAKISNSIDSALDIALVGATVGISQFVKDFAKSVVSYSSSTLENIVIQQDVDFVSQLQNTYLLCNADEMIHIMVHLINQHPTKKHFIFFNHVPSLVFFRDLFLFLSQKKNSLLLISNIYMMHEELNEKRRFEEYNAFLRPIEKSSKSVNAASRKRQFGKIMLCTDIAAFGLDVRDVDYCYHIEPPVSLRAYVHRIGRVGRMGMRGVSVLLLPVFIPNKISCFHPADSAKSARFSSSCDEITSSSLIKPAFFHHKISREDLSEEQKDYLDALCDTQPIRPYPYSSACAPISSTIRRIINEESDLLKKGRKAAMSMCTPTSKISSDLAEEENHFETAKQEKTDCLKESKRKKGKRARINSPSSTPNKQVLHSKSLISWFTPQIAIKALLLN